MKEMLDLMKGKVKTAQGRLSLNMQPGRVVPTDEEVCHLIWDNSINIKYNALTRFCPRCKSELEFTNRGFSRVVQCSKETCIWLVLPGFLPRFVLNDLILKGNDLSFDELMEIIMGEKPGFSRLITLKPNAPQWAIDEYEALKKSLEEVV